MTDVRACVLGCKSADRVPFRAAPGRLACDRCAEKLAGVLADIALIYATLTDPESLIPGGGGFGQHAVPGPRSPAADAILVHTDVRSSTEPGQRPAALAAVEGWARAIREERSAAVPAGRITMTRELATIRFNWEWILSREWLEDFAVEMRDVLAALKAVGHMAPTVLRIGTCPTLIAGIVLDNNEVIPLLCGAVLRVAVGDQEIRCRNCGSMWPRARWTELGDPWTDYARLSVELGVVVGTLRRWASEDGWSVGGQRGRRLTLRAEALESFRRRRGAAPLEQAG